MNRTLVILIMTEMALLSGCSTATRYSPLAALERKLVYQPTAFPPDLGIHEMPFENVSFQSEDGTRLHGWYADHPNPVAVALFCHGNAGNIASRSQSLITLNKRHGLSVMMFDYRGYGRSEGKPTEDGVLADARAARAWVANRTGISQHEVVLFGRSLGGAVAVDLAAKDGARGLILESTFTSMPAVAKGVVPMLPTSLLMRQRFNSLKKMKNYLGPLLQSHGDADELIPIEQGRKLFAAATSERKQFIVISGGNHNSPQSEEFHVALDDFLRGL